MADNKEKSIEAGDVVRFEDGDVRGLFNSGNGEFVYISVTTPPINFGYAYQQRDN